jgi:5-methylcytosine-specific restriction protein A
MRREFSTQVRLEALARCRGYCEECTRKLLGPGDFHYDHIVPAGLDGEPTLENCAVLCRTCHKLKTSGEDIPRISKAKRQLNKHFGIKPPSRWPKQRFGS